MSHGVMSDEDKKWRAQYDASRLKDALEVQKDPERLKNAQEYLKKELEDLSSLIGSQPAKKTNPKSESQSSFTPVATKNVRDAVALIPKRK